VEVDRDKTHLVTGVPFAPYNLDGSSDFFSGERFQRVKR
jgi:hypothetical protein